MGEREILQKYGDIIDMPHHRSLRHPPLSTTSRAAQFSPFAALTGYNDVLKETRRLTDEKPELTAEVLQEINETLAKVRVGDTVMFTYFVPDELKEGGACVTKKGVIRKIRSYERQLLLEDGTTVPMEEILEIDRENNE